MNRGTGVIAIIRAIALADDETDARRDHRLWHVLPRRAGAEVRADDERWVSPPSRSRDERGNARMLGREPSTTASRLMDDRLARAAVGVLIVNWGGTPRAFRATCARIPLFRAVSDVSFGSEGRGDPPDLRARILASAEAILHQAVATGDI